VAGFGEGRLQILPVPEASGRRTCRTASTITVWTIGSRKAGLVMDPAGNLYGTTWGGAYHYGAVFEITPLGNSCVSGPEL